MKCDTKKSNSDQCKRCFHEWVTSDDDDLASLIPCKADGCGVRHLRVNMIEKIEGHYCDSCAKEYEEKLLQSMAAREPE